MVHSLIPTARNASLVPRRSDLFAPFEDHFNSFFDGFFKDLSGVESFGSISFPKMDVFENNGKFCVKVAATGMSSDDIDVEVQSRPRSNGASLTGNDEEWVLHISGKMSSEYKSPEEDGATYYLKELRQSSFKRSLVLPWNVVPDEPRAVMKDGILMLEWDTVKSPVPESNIKKIPISSE